MPNIKPIVLTNADAPTAATLNAVKAKLGVIPNMFLTWAHSPVALNAYMQLSGLTGEGKLNAKQREQIALAVGQENACGYCVSAHTVIGNMVGLTATETAAARQGRATDVRDAVLVELLDPLSRA